MVFCLFAAPTAMYAQEDASVLEGALIGAVSEGDDSGAARLIKEVIAADPDSYTAEFYLKALNNFWGSFANDNYTVPEFEEFLNGLLRKGLKNEYNKSLIKEMLAAELMSRDEFRQAKELSVSQGLMDRWLVIGSFGDYGESCFYEVLPPEKKIDLSETYKVGDYEIKWQKAQTYKLSFSELFRNLKNTGGVCVYMATYVYLPAEQPAMFEIYSEAPYKLFVNNVEAGINDTLKELTPLERCWPATLNEGWNLVMLKMIGRPAGSFSIKLTDLQGRPFDGLKNQVDGFEGDMLPKIEKPGREIPAGVMRKDIFTCLREKQDKTFADYCRLIVLLREYNMKQDALKFAEEFRAKYPVSAYAAYALGKTYEEMGYFLTQEKADNKAKELYEKSLTEFPEFIPSLLGLAEFFAEKDKDAAIDYCRQALDANPDCFQACYMLSRLYAEKNWKPEKIREMRRMLELKPESEGVLDMWADYYEGLGNPEKALEFRAKSMAVNNYKFYWPLLRRQMETDRFDEALNSLQYAVDSFPEDSYYIREMKDIYLKQGRMEKAEEAYRKMIALDPDDYMIKQELAELYARFGKNDLARGIWTEILSAPAYLGVFDGELNEYLKYLDNDEGIAKGMCERDIVKIAKGSPGREEYPDNSVIVLLEQNIVEIYGDDFKAKREYTNEVIKILNKEGGEQYGELYPRGQQIETRVLTPDGRVLEPDPVQEGASTRLPKLDEDSVIQRFYYSDGNCRSGRGLTMLFSADEIRRGKQPVLKYQFVLVMPAKTTDFSLRQLNLPGAYVKEEKDGKAIYKWDFTDIDDFEPEQLMPPREEILPVLMGYSGRADYGFNIKRSASRAVRLIVPENVKEKTLELTKDAQDEYQKICRLYEFVVTEIKTGYGENPSQTLIMKEGSHFGLFTAMLKAAGIEFNYAFIRPKEFFKVDWDLDPPGFYAQMLYIPKAGDRENIWIFIDRFVPIGVIPVELQGGEALLADAMGNTRFTTLPDKQAEEKANMLKTDIVLNADGSAEFEMTLRLSPETSARVLSSFKENLNEKQIQQQMQGIVSNFFPDCTVKDYKLPVFNVDSTIMDIVISGATKKYAALKKKRLSFKPIAMPLPIAGFLRESKRKFPMRIPYEFTSKVALSETIRIKLPEGASCKLPQSESVYTRFGAYTLQFSRDMDAVVIKRFFSVMPQDIEPEKYKDFVDFAKKIEAAEKQSLNVYVGKE